MGLSALSPRLAAPGGPSSAFPPLLQIFSRWGGRGQLNPEIIGAKAGLGLKDISRVPPLIYFFGKQEAGFSFHPKSSQNVAVFIAAFIYLFLPFVGNRRVCS